MAFDGSQITFDYISKAKFAFVFSFIVIVGSFYVWFQTGDGKFGIDYKGGHELIVKIGSDADTSSIRNALKGEGLANAVVQAFEAASNEYSIRISGEAGDSKTVRGQLTSALKDKFGKEVDIVKSDFVGPTIGQELRRKAIVALIVGLIGILCYVTYRFEFAFALGAVAALFHDVIVCLGIYLFTGRVLDVGTLAAALTIVGYSVNDTIIVFDRMREEMAKAKKFDLQGLMNYSISNTLSRTVITSLLTLFSAVALLIFGGGAISNLSLFLVVGVITGTYSTIFIASPVALLWEGWRNPDE